jgi:hypothetical protein
LKNSKAKKSNLRGNLRGDLNGDLKIERSFFFGKL